MAGRYERVNLIDEDDEPETPTVTATPTQMHPIPNSPPPSFRSRASSLLSHRTRVDPALEDAFEAEDESDDEADDRQRLVRGNTHLVSGNPLVSSTTTTAPAERPLPQTPQFPVSSATATPLRIYGSGIQADGVFSNLSAKPERGQAKEEQPPTYEQAAADAAPPYWETTIFAPGMGGADEVYIDGMPVGSFFSFLWNAMISMSFQLVGFILTYLLHSTHAAKNGSRAGLGITLINYGFYMKTSGPHANPSQMNGADGIANPPDPNSHEFDPNTVTSDGSSGGISDITGAEWISYALMIVGWFILIRAVSDYLRARRHEQLVLQSPDRGLGIPIIAEGETSERVV